MGGPRRWTVLETEFLQDCAVFSVSRTLSKSPRTGESHSFYRIDSEDWVNIVPITPGGDFVLVKQYREVDEEKIGRVFEGVIEAVQAIHQDLGLELGVVLEEPFHPGGVDVPGQECQDLFSAGGQVRDPHERALARYCAGRGSGTQAFSWRVRGRGPFPFDTCPGSSLASIQHREEPLKPPHP